MLRMTRKTDYALISLAWLAEHSERVWSAREIAHSCGLPTPLLMNILKTLHQRGILRSVRGSAGGYQISVDLDSVSLLDLIEMLEKDNGNGQAQRRLSIHGPAQALQYRLGGFMRTITLADLVMPGRRIDVPLEGVGVRAINQANLEPATAG